MKNKKLAILATIFLLTATTATVAGCNKGQQKPTTSSYEVSFASDSMLMTLGDESAVIADYKLVEGQTLSFSSSDESVVTVDEYGRVKALSEGKATITVRYGTASDTCEITVSMNGLLPLLQMEGVPTDAIVMNTSSTLDLSGSVLFNNKVYTDVTMNYELSDPSVGTVEDGIFVPMGTGATEIYVTASWRGSTAASLTKTISVTVSPDLLFMINDGDSEFTLYTQSQMVAPFVVTAEVGEEVLSASIEVTSGSEYVKYDAENQQLVSLGYTGEAVVTVSCEVNGEAMMITVPVSVKPTVYEYQSVVKNFSAIHGDVSVGTTLRALLGGDIVSAIDEDGNALEVKNNKVYGVKSSKDGKFTSKITVFTKKYGYAMNIEGYSGMFSKAEDFAVFDTNVSYSSATKFVPVDSAKAMQKWEGYYVLMNNIDASEYTHKQSGKGLHSRGIQSSKPYGFYGTFDGQGYTVKGMTVQAYGIFGYIVDAEIKDVAFTDVTLDDTTEYSTVLAAWIDNSIVSNVYVSIANEGVYGARAACFAGGANVSTIKACVVETKESFSFKDGLKAVGCFNYLNRERYNNDALQGTFEEVYVISGAVTGYYNDTNTYLKAENEDATVPEGDNAVTLEGVKKYATLAEQQADTSNTYATFSSDCWDIENGKLTWKSMNGNYPSADDLISDKIPDKETVGDFDVSWI